MHILSMDVFKGDFLTFQFWAVFLFLFLFLLVPHMYKLLEDAIILFPVCVYKWKYSDFIPK